LHIIGDQDQGQFPAGPGNDDLAQRAGIPGQPGFPIMDFKQLMFPGGDIQTDRLPVGNGFQGSQDLFPPTLQGNKPDPLLV